MISCLSDFPHQFYVFSDKLGNNEGHDSEKILYGYPPSRSLDDQLKDVGLAEAFFRFYNTFAPPGKFRILKSADGRMALHSPEPTIYMCLALKFPSVRLDEGQSGSNAASVLRSTGYIADSLLSTILVTFYKMWNLHNGSITTLLEEHSVADCKNRLQDFFDRFLSLAQPFIWNLLDTFSGVSFLPLERTSYLRIHSFLNRMECTFNEVSACLFFFSNLLTWSGLNQEDTRVMYMYANRFLELPLGDNMEMRKSQSTGRFLQPIFGGCGPDNIALKAHLSTYSSPAMLVAYRLLSVTIFIVVEDEKDFTTKLVHEISDFFMENLLMLASDLGKVSVPANVKEEPNFKFIYYNTSNSALKSTIHDEKTRLIVLPPDTLTRMLMLADYLSALEPVELSTSVSTDSWVTVKKTAQRQLFLVVSRQRGTCTLINVADEIRKLSSTTFSDILFLEI